MKKNDLLRSCGIEQAISWRPTHAKTGQLNSAGPCERNSIKILGAYVDYVGIVRISTDLVRVGDLQELGIRA
jgi:hypothetical protein